MEESKKLLLHCVDSCVSAGIRSYVGLICCGELQRSRLLLSDSLRLSAIASGGPSALGQGRSLSLLTIRNILATLLVLRATAYWRKVAALRELQDRCADVVTELGMRDCGSECNCLGECRRGGVCGSGDASGRTVRCKLNGCSCGRTDRNNGRRRNDALPAEPELCFAVLPELPAPEHRHDG